MTRLAPNDSLPALPPNAPLEPLSPSLAKHTPLSSTPPEEDDPVAVEEEGFQPGKILGLIRRKYWLLIIGVLLLTSMNVVKTLRQRPVYKGNFRIQVEPIQARKQLQELTGESSAAQEFDYASQIEILLSPKVLAPIAETVAVQFPGTDYGAIAGSLSVIRLGETKVIEVTYTNPNPQLVKAVLDQVSQSYLNYSREDQRAQFRQGLKFVNAQLPKTQNQANNFQQELQRLRQRYGFLDPDVYAKEINGQLSKATEQRQTLQAEHLALQARYDTLKGIASDAALNQSGPYQAYLQQNQVLERQIAIESARLGDRNPTIELYRQQQANLLPLLQREAKRALNNQIAAVSSDMAVIKARDDALRAIEKRLQKQFQEIPAVSRRYSELLQQIAVLNDSLKRLLETQETLELAASQNDVPWQLITPPRDPESQLASSLSKALTSGLMTGAILGLVIAFGLEKIEGTFYELSELRKHTGLPIFGVIPLRKDIQYGGPVLHQVDFLQQSELTALAIARDHLDPEMAAMFPSLEAGQALVEPSVLVGDVGMLWDASLAYPFLEAFRTLYTHLSQLKTVRTIAVSSAWPEEGKTTVAVMLAQAIAAMNNRVLLVDAHLRQVGTKAHEMVGLQQSPGLSDYLLDLAPLPTCFQKTPWEAKLWVVSSGSVVTDPSRFLASEKMTQFMQSATQEFDWIIYDVPSLAALADARVIASQTHGLLLVSQMGRRGIRGHLSSALEQLQYAKIPVLGIVANRVKDLRQEAYQRSR